MQHKLIASALLAALLGLNLPAVADVVVVVNKANTQTVDAALVAKIYTGSTLTWSDGSSIAVFEQDAAATHGQFAASIGKTPANLKAIWARLMFAGQATPPAVVANDAAVKAAVSRNKDAIGYIDAASVDDTVRVVKK